ncbi:MAG: hypothetical protein PHQ65_09270 [Bacteroidales bacterium]|nr:hypothetical protein [Bacteroidales bacterium]MDD3665439.1 hypothetical protein [Bacteroidales bacterium]
MLKQIFIKFALLTVLLIFLGVVYQKWFFEGDLQKHSEIINLIRNVPDSAAVIYLGESSNITYRANDIDKRSISAFLGDYFPSLLVTDVTKPAAHAGVYKVLLDQFSDFESGKIVVVTMNLRSFNAQWIYSNLETALQKSMVLLQPYPPFFNRFLLSFKAYDIKTDAERTNQFKAQWVKDEFHLPFKFSYRNVADWDNAYALKGFRDSSGAINSKLTELGCHFIKAYGFQIDTASNPRIRDFNHIVDWAQKHNQILVFNLMPENVQLASKLVGDTLVYMIKENMQLLVDYYKRKGVVVVNNGMVVPSDQFVDQDYPTEHYAQAGRRIVARNVADAIKKWRPSEYEDFQPVDLYQTHFYNDCDHKMVWGQMQTITDEFAHSGIFSSQTGNGNDYSITLEYPLNLIPDSLVNTISVDFWMMQRNTNHDAKLVIQAEGDDFSGFWQGIPVLPYMSANDRWFPFHFEMTIPDSIRNASMLKVYLYNPSKSKVFIDDLKIEINK